MCTAVAYRTRDHYFGRNLDLEYSYSETVTVTPRNYPFRFRKMGTMPTHYAMIGMAYVVEDYPLYYDATNETGLSMAGLNFPGNACYHEIQESRDNVSPFEFIPWVLGQCADLEAAQAYGLKAVRESGLPGRYCPLSAARALYHAVVRWEEEDHG